jgi:hypothetical protein
MQLLNTIQISILFTIYTIATSQSKATASFYSMKSNFERDPYLLDENAYFSAKINDALKVVATILDNTRNPSLASPDHVHTYDDKFTLTEFVTNIGISSLINVLNNMGLGDDPLVTTDKKPEQVIHRLINLIQDDKKSITLRFSAKETCTFVKEEEVEKERPEVFEKTTTQNILGQTKTKTVVSKVVQKVKQFHWKVDIKYDIYLYYGAETSLDATNSIPIITKASTSCDIVTMTSQPPRPTSHVKPIDVNLTWLLQHIERETLNAKFSIDREQETCRTPRNNDDVRQAWSFFINIKEWFYQVSTYFMFLDDQMFQLNDQNIQSNPRAKRFLASIDTSGIFVPVLPVFESLSKKENETLTDEKQSPILSYNDANIFLSKQSSTISANVAEISRSFSDEPFMSSREAVIVSLTRHAASITEMWCDSINHIEDMLCTQLYNAVGKHITSNDVDEFVKSYNQKLFIETYAPEPFSYAIRRPNHYPDGEISIEETKLDGNGNDSAKHAMTFTRQLEGGEYPMSIPINSATSVEFKGDLFLHAWMLQRFQEKPSFRLASRARQFSSFLLLVGKISGPNSFEPEHGIILQNQDEVLIPLIMDEMPSSKEFKDAIESLSPEQQRFAQALRNMKLSSSVFGICVVQLKPQLEKLLGLPEHSLTKEIRLTQDLLSLFIDYQIPSDLLSFDGEDDLEPALKVEKVKLHVKNVQDMINDLKKREMEEARQKTDMAFEEAMADAFDDEYVEDGASSYVASTTGEGAVGGRPRPKPNKKQGNMMFKNRPMTMPLSEQREMLMTSAMPSAQRSSMMDEQVLNMNPQKPPIETIESTKGSQEDVILKQESVTESTKLSDLTMIPKVFDSKFELFGSDERYGGAMRSTVIKTSENWKKHYKQTLLSKVQSKVLSIDEKKAERSKAFDLLDALSRSGALSLSHAELHVIIASTHCFDKSVVSTVVQDNVNPIEKIERSQLLVASIIHDIDVRKLISNSKEVERISRHSPTLIEDKNDRIVDS